MPLIGAKGELAGRGSSITTDASRAEVADPAQCAGRRIGAVAAMGFVAQVCVESVSVTVQSRH